jgi:hypothetical protein
MLVAADRGTETITDDSDVAEGAEQRGEAEVVPREVDKGSVLDTVALVPHGSIEHAGLLGTRGDEVELGRGRSRDETVTGAVGVGVGAKGSKVSSVGDQ